MDPMGNEDNNFHERSHEVFFGRDPGKTHGDDNERVSRWGSWFDEVSDDSTRDVHGISSIYLFRFCR